MNLIAITIGTEDGAIIARADKDAEKSGLIQYMDFVKIRNMVNRITQITDFHDFPTDNKISLRAKKYLQNHSGPNKEDYDMLYKRLVIEPMGEVYSNGELAEYMGGIGYFEPAFPANGADIVKLYPSSNRFKIGQITSGIKISDVPYHLTHEALSRHFAIFGKNGSGKTNFLKELSISGIRARPASLDIMNTEIIQLLCNM